MTDAELGLRRILRLVREWRIGLIEAERLIREEFRGGVTPTTPPDTGTTLPGPRARFWRRGLGRVVG